MLRCFGFLRRVRHFHDLPLWTKLLVVPAACIAAGLAVAASIWVGATETEGRLAEVANKALPTAAASARLLDTVDKVQVMAMRAMVWQQAGVPQATLDALASDIGRELDGLQTMAAGMAGGLSERDVDRPHIKAIGEKSAVYAKRLGDALDLIADPAVAAGYFRRADATFESLRGDISEISASHRAAEAASVQAARYSSHAGLIRLYWILGGSGLVMLILLPVVVAAIARPVRLLTRTMTELAAGNMAAEATGQDSRDELGDMARAVLVFKDSMIRESRQAAEQKAERQCADMEKRAALVHMAETIEAATGSALEEIGGRTTAMATIADAMSASAGRTGLAARDAAVSAAQARTNAQNVADAAEELATSIGEIGEQVSQSAAVFGRAVAAAAETRATIGTLNQEVETIGEVADMIGAVAAKTNLLALNATIEAARAGEAGKGFAVVAAEVKALAMQSARATGDIARHINQVRSATGASVAAVARIDQTITEISAIASSIADAVRQQDAAAAEIAHNVAETARAADEMTSRTTDVSNEAVGTGRYAVDVRDNTMALNQAVRELQHSLVQVVRTSTAEVERRRDPRHAVDIACRLSIEGDGDYDARVSDISEGGARVRGGPDAPVGTRGMLRVDGVGVPLLCVVRAAGAGGLHLAFEPDDAAALRPVLERLTVSLVAPPDDNAIRQTLVASGTP